MTEEEFAARVARLERRSARDPAGYRRSVLAWTWLGLSSAWLASVALLALALLIFAGLWRFLSAFFALKLAKMLVLPLLLVAGRLFKSLTAPLESPTGIPVDAQAFPALFRLIERVAGSAGAEVPDTVLVTNEFNASVSQIPTRPLLPTFRETLTLGLPLLASCTPAEFEAVLAHEFGHLAGAHGKLSAHVYRLRNMWTTMSEKLAGPTAWFLRWFAPRYNAQTFVLARQQEIEADQLAARLTSPRTLGDALVRSTVEDVVHDEEFWAPLQRRTQQEPEPPHDTLTALARAAPTLGIQPQREEALQHALARAHDVLDTHPSLRERLEALGVEPRVPPPVERSAAQELFGDGLERLTAQLDAQWRESVAPVWASAHRQADAIRTRLQELEARHAAGEAAEMDPAAQAEAAGLDLEMGILYRSLGRDGSALQALTRAHQRQPDDPSVQFHLGRLLLELGDEAGLPLLDRARAADEDFELEATRLIHAHHLDAGEAGAERAAEERERLERAFATEELLERERSTLSPDDELSPVSLAPELHAALVAALREGQVKAAWVAAKVSKIRPKEHVLVIAIDPDEWGDDPESRAAHAEASFDRACAALRIDVPWLALSAPKHPDLAKRIRAVAGTPLV